MMVRYATSSSLELEIHDCYFDREQRTMGMGIRGAMCIKLASAVHPLSPAPFSP